nr:SNF-related serine/threonine-protein kinase-like [Ciona intestinalis]|eukprot:XP_002120588.1 SNF-related serine/threonine-protein kinase-like [Ciona intestinalis]
MWQSSEHNNISKLYELKKTLGRGHFAVVKLAHHLFSGEKVAVKVIDKTKMDKVSADHLYHEVACMKLVQHPNVVRLYQVIETSSKLYLILELGDGGDMFDYIMRHERGLHEDQAKEYFAQIVSAIAYCHKLHVVHRDLKPENVVFFESQGLVKLTDFGFSNQYQPGEKLSTSCGSLAYSAPEILLGEEYDAPAVDVWSLGVILYMLVCGIAPFNEANDSETLTNIMDCRYTVLEHVSPQCQDLIKKMIIRDPVKRIHLNEIICHPWLQGAKSLRRARRNSTPILERNLIPDHLHKEILQKMISGQLADEHEILKSLEEDRYDHITSTYFLLAEQNLMQQEESKSNSKKNQTLLDVDISTITATTNIPIQTYNPDLSNTTSKLSVSPPQKQSTLLSYSMPSDVARSRTASSSSEDSVNLSSRAAERRSSPSYIREHLTITPRHGFSVVRGGIDTLIEEEERSRSQTTTDDEADNAEDITNMVNPNVLASHLQRASLQLKRIKKRKSAPVLNEICEENESETDVTMSSGDAGTDTSRQFMSVFPSKCSLPKDSGSQPIGMIPNVTSTAYNVRTGRPQRRQRSRKSSNSDTSEEESESSHTSQTNLSSVVSNMMLRYHRDSSEDRDGCGGQGGSFGPGAAHGSACVTDCTIESTSNTQNTEDCNAGNNQGNQNRLNNTLLLNSLSKKRLLLQGSDQKIINVFGVRSRSAESHTTASVHLISRNSSARSSCSSLSSSSQMWSSGKEYVGWVTKNTSSTRSDTGLVLRCHTKNYGACKCKKNESIARSCSSFPSLYTSPQHCRFCYTLSGKEAVDAFGNALIRKPLTSSILISTRSRIKHGIKYTDENCSDNYEVMNPAVVAHEAVSVKQSNLSIASSTCSGSKFVVDPVNELPPPPYLTTLPKPAINKSLTNDWIHVPCKEYLDNKCFDCIPTIPNDQLKENSLKCTPKVKRNGIIARLNSYKTSRGVCATPLAYRAENSVIKKMKAQDCCTLM